MRTGMKTDARQFRSKSNLWLRRFIRTGAGSEYENDIAHEILCTRRRNADSIWDAKAKGQGGE